jgi:hypothetical protein
MSCDEFERVDEQANERTLQRGWVKLHAGCGGLVRYVEAYDDPHVGWTGQCCHCDRDGIVEEHIVFITEPAIPEQSAREFAMEGPPASTLADLEYPLAVQERDGFDAAQRELRERLRDFVEGPR